MNNNTNNSLEKHYIGHRSRLKEKFNIDDSNLFNYELIELLLFFSIPRKDTKIIAKNILSENNNSLKEIFYGNFSSLKKINGIGESTLTLFKIISKIYKKISVEEVLNQKISIDNMDSLVNFLQCHIGFMKKEHFCEIFMNNELEIIKFSIYDYGTIDEIAIYSREIISKAIELGASNLIIAHNHPSQFLSKITPSEADKRITLELNKMLLNLKINLIDHIIISGEKYFSFYSNGLL